MMLTVRHNPLAGAETHVGPSLADTPTGEGLISEWKIKRGLDNTECCT